LSLCGSSDESLGTREALRLCCAGFNALADSALSMLSGGRRRRRRGRTGAAAAEPTESAVVAATIQAANDAAQCVCAVLRSRDAAGLEGADGCTTGAVARLCTALQVCSAHGLASALEAAVLPVLCHAAAVVASEAMRAGSLDKDDARIRELVRLATASGLRNCVAVIE
jgi:hypothetical protein